MTVRHCALVTFVNSVKRVEIRVFFDERVALVFIWRRSDGIQYRLKILRNATNCGARLLTKRVTRYLGDFRGRKCPLFLVKKTPSTNVLQLRCGIVTKRVKRSSSISYQHSCLLHLAKSLKSRLQPSEGARPGRPSDPTWNQYGKLPMSDETAQLLGDLANHLSSEDRKISPMQVAAHLLELQLRKY